MSSDIRPAPSTSTSTVPRPSQQPLSSSLAGPSRPSVASYVITPADSMPPKKRKPEADTKERLPSLGVDHSTDDESVSVAQSGREGKRTRVHFSCVECHRRKQKCDRKEPCSQCVARRVPHLCRPFLNGVEENSSDVHARLGAIEALLGRLVSSLPSSGAVQPQPMPGPDVSALTATASGEDYFHPASQSAIDMTNKPPPSGFFPTSIASSAPPGKTSFGWGLREGRLISLSVDDNPDLRDMISTLKESGISKNHLEWLLAGVPGRRMADALVDLYFRDIDWTRYKTNRPSFMRSYNAFFDSIHRSPANPHIDADTLKWLPLLFIVLAISTLSAPNDVVPTPEQSAWSRRFYGSARSGLEYAKALQRDNLDVLSAGLLASRYMLLTRRPAEGSTPLTTAFQVGLYRDGTVLNLSDKREIEIRRRAWAMLYHLDRTISLLVGRPASISDAHTDTRMPANLDDEELEDPSFDPAGHPMTKPTVYTYVIVRHKLAEIMGRIAYHTFAIQLPDYSTVLDLDKELLAWRETLPPFFRMSNPDTSLDATYPYLFVQRHLLACEWYYTRITLNRPYLLRRKPQDGRYSYSKDAAIESATADLLSRRAFVMEKGNLIINSGGYRVLNSYMVLGVTIKLDPESPQADNLRHLLNVVSGRASDSSGRISEPLVKEELAIVEFLTAKTSRASSSARRSLDQTPVDLLLGLAKTRSGKRAAEEEARQLRLQTARDREEQAIQNGSGGGRHGASTGNDSNPWNYVAPQMPGLDVQQPFGDGMGRKVPKPLQPPPPKRSDGQSGWSPDISFADMDMVGQPSFQTISRHSPNSQGQAQSQVSNRMVPQTPLGHMFQQQQQQQHQQSSRSPDTVFSSPRRDTISTSTGMQISPYRSLTSLPYTQSQTSFQGHAQVSNHNGQMHSGSNGDLLSADIFGPGGQFGTNFDSFDFSDLGLATGQGLETGGVFNPFALQQTEEGGSEGMGPDDETQFLNYILTKFANSQPEMQ